MDAWGFIFCPFLGSTAAGPMGRLVRTGVHPRGDRKSAETSDSRRVAGAPLRKRARNRLIAKALHGCDSKERSYCDGHGEGWEKILGSVRRAGVRFSHPSIAGNGKIVKQNLLLVRYSFERLTKSFKYAKLERGWGEKVTIRKIRSKVKFVWADGVRISDWSCSRWSGRLLPWWLPRQGQIRP